MARVALGASLLLLLMPAPGWAGKCKDGDAKACFSLGERHARGKGVPRDYPVAAKFFRKACRGGVFEGCTRLGFMFHRGLGVEKDEAAGARLYTKACEGGEPDGCELLATCYMRGEGVKASPEQAAELMARARSWMGTDGPKDGHHLPGSQPTKEQLDAACQVGQGRACLGLGRWYSFPRKSEKREADPTTGLRYFLKGCDKGEPVACTGAGVHHQHGMGTTKSEKRAAELFTRACAAEEGQACHYLAQLFEEGAGVKHDPGHALKLYDQACVQKVPRSCLRAGLMHALGEVSKADAAAAAAAFSAGCELEEMYACAMLGVHFENGAGTAKDPKQAERSFEAAWTFALVRLSDDPEDRNLVCDHAELAINLRRPTAEVRDIVDKCVQTSKEPYQLVVAHVLSATAALLAGEDPTKAAKAVAAALPGAKGASLNWSFKTLRVGVLGRPHRDVLLPLFMALDDAKPADREAKVAPLLKKLRK